MPPGRNLALLFVTAICAVVAACDTASGPTEAPSASAAAASASPGFVASPEPTIPEPTESLPVPSPAATGASASGTTEPPVSAAECSGTQENRDFYAYVAAAVDWTVYCPILSSGWFVDTGHYRLAGGGRLEIAYKGPGGARLELREGAICTTGVECVPPSTDVGVGLFGDREGTLFATDDGRWAVSVETGEVISWLAVGSGVTQDAFAAMTADFKAISD